MRFNDPSRVKNLTKLCGRALVIPVPLKGDRQAVASDLARERFKL